MSGKTVSRGVLVSSLVAALALAGCGPSSQEPRLPGYSSNGLERGAGAASESGPVSVGPTGTGPAGADSSNGPQSIGPLAVGPGAVGPGPVGQGAVGGYHAY